MSGQFPPDDTHGTDPHHDHYLDEGPTKQCRRCGRWRIGRRCAKCRRDRRKARKTQS